MSFFGSIGYIMQESGIPEALSLIYEPKSLEKMLNGHAYAKVVRAHTLLQLTLAIIISKNLAIDEEMVANLDITITNVINNNVSYSDIESGNDNEMCNALLYKFNEKLKEFEKRGPTSKLWVQYLNMVSIAKEFIRAERMGDWQGYLNSIKEMLSYFHASGHFPYAKSAHIQYWTKHLQPTSNNAKKCHFAADKTSATFLVCFIFLSLVCVNVTEVF